MRFIERILLIAALLVLAAAPCFAQTFVQSIVATNSTGTSITATFASAPTQNNLLAAVFATQSATASLANPSGWSTAIDNLNTTEDDLLRIAYKVAGAGEPSAVTFTGITDDAGQRILAIYEFSGTETSSPLDQTATTARTTGATSLSSGSVTTTTANQVIIPGFAIRAATSAQSFNNSFTLQNATVAGSFTNLNGYRVVTATGTYSTTASWTTAGTAWAAIASFKGTGGAAPPSNLPRLGCCGKASFTIGNPAVAGGYSSYGFNFSLVPDLNALATYPACDAASGCKAGVRICQAGTTTKCADFFSGEGQADVYLLRKQGTAASQAFKAGVVKYSAPAVWGAIP